MEYRTSVPRTLGLVGLGVLMIAVSYFTAQMAAGFLQAVGWFGVVFFGLCLVAILFQLFRRGPTVIIDEVGVLDRRLGIGPIPWQDISSVSITQVKRQRFISLWLRNEDDYLSRVPVWRRKLAQANQAMGFSPFSIAFTGLTPGLDEAYTRLRARVPERAGVQQSFEGSVMRLRLSGVVVRPLNFTVRGTCSGAKFQAPPLRLASETLRCRGAQVRPSASMVRLIANRGGDALHPGAPLRKR
jgi:hypothetical protein